LCSWTSHATSAFYCNNKLYHFDNNTPELKLLNNITDIELNKELYSEESISKLKLKYLILINVYKDTTEDKQNKMNTFLEFELFSNIFSNINYYYNNGANDSKQIPIFFEKAIKKNDVKTITLLIENFNSKNKDRNILMNEKFLNSKYSYINPLIWAIDNSDMFKLLINNGADATILFSGKKDILDKLITIFTESSEEKRKSMIPNINLIKDEFIKQKKMNPKIQEKIDLLLNYNIDNMKEYLIK
jgi:hypothetical protein